MQGIFIGLRRPKSKKEIREVAASDPGRIVVEDTSLYGDEFGGLLTELRDGDVVHFVGPDPFSKRNFYGTIVRKGDTFKVS